MKTLIHMIALAAMAVPLLSHAQSGFTGDTVVIQAGRKENPVFTALAIVSRNQGPSLQFSVRKVQNVRNYRVEAGNDTTALDYIGNVVPKCNTVLPSTFAYPLDRQTAAYRYYRVVQVSMAQEWIASPLLQQMKTSARGMDTNDTDSAIIRCAFANGQRP